MNPDPSAVHRARNRPGSPDVPPSNPILLAVTGMSPAVLTETIWGLACEKPPVIPRRVVAITTLPGKNRIESELFAPSPDYQNRSPWEALREAVFARLGSRPSPTPARDLLIFDDIRVIASHDPKLGRSFPLEDIRTPAENEMAADFVLDEVRKITANSETALIASLAGGRKTMGALLYAALSLLGRPQDRLTHVLVAEPFDDPGLNPRFYFPAPGLLHQHPRTGAALPGDSARIWLADVPFVPLRELFPRQLGRYPGSFNSLVRAYSQRIEAITGPPDVVANDPDLSLQIGDTRVQLAPREYLLFSFLLERCRQGQPPYRQQKEALDDFNHWRARWSQRLDLFSPLREAAEAWQHPTDDDFRRQLSAIRAKFRRAGLARLEPFLLPQRGAFGLRLQPPA
jgi:CRISPR-associated protein (TIGR02584 family)